MTSQPDVTGRLARARRCARCAIVGLLLHAADHVARGASPAQVEPTPDPPPRAA